MPVVAVTTVALTRCNNMSASCPMHRPGNGWSRRVTALCGRHHGRLDGGRCGRYLPWGLAPGNILFDEDCFVKVTDFGVARALGKDAGADPYASPEVRDGATATRASDMYSLAVVLYELATGRRPAEVGATTGKTEPLHVAHPGYSQAFGECLARMLSKRPEDRPGSYNDVLKVLEEKRRAKQRPAKVLRGGGDLATGGLRPEDAAAHAAMTAPRRKSGRGATIVNVLLLGGLVALCALFLAYRLRQRRSDTMPITDTPSLTLPTALPTARRRLLPRQNCRKLKAGPRLRVAALRDDWHGGDDCAGRVGVSSPTAGP